MQKFQNFFLKFKFSGQLQIKDAQESDQGKYECVAANDVGSQYSYSAQLYVRGKNFYQKFREIKWKIICFMHLYIFSYFIRYD